MTYYSYAKPIFCVWGMCQFKNICPRRNLEWEKIKRNIKLLLKYALQKNNISRRFGYSFN